MTFHRLAQYFQQLESVSSRLKMTEILADLFKSASPQEINLVCYLSLGQLGPKHDQTEFNLAEKMLIRVLSQAFHASATEVKKLYKTAGDIGEVAYQLAQHPSQDLFSSDNQADKSSSDSVSKKSSSASRKHAPRHVPSTKSLSVSQIYAQLLTLARDSGQGSQERKVSALAQLLTQVDPLSAKYLARIPVGKLRLGFSDMTIIDALSWLVTGDKSLHDDLESAYNVAADVGLIAQTVRSSLSRSKSRSPSPSLVKKVTSQLSNVHVVLGTPIVPELCQRLKSFDEIIDKMGQVAVEPKYDGTRLQIHFSRSPVISSPAKQDREISKNKNPKTLKAYDSRLTTKFLIKSFTRNLEENSHMFPELASIGQHLRAKSFILDCEAVGVDPQTGKWLPFQLTITRKRKHQVSDQQAKVPLKFMVFDLLYLNGRDLHRLPLKTRRQQLQKILPSGKVFDLTPQTITSDPQVCRRLHHQYLDQGLEGVVIKRWDSPYVPGRKGWNWVKMKEVETAAAGLSDTIDCVVMGYYRGRGKRAAFGLGAFLVGIVNSPRHFYPERSRRAEATTKSSSTVTEESHPKKNQPSSLMKRIPPSLLKRGAEGVEFLTLSKIGTGLTDDQFKQLRRRLKPLEIKNKPDSYLVDKNLFPDVWVKPSLVVEIAADNLTKSPTHTAGLALRFPRLLKFRDDKSPDQATTLSEVKTLYQLQK
jgi:DNA ligase-1